MELNFQMHRKSAFIGKNQKEIITNNKCGKIRFISPKWEFWSSDCKNTVKALLGKNPEKRVSLEQIFNLKWLKKHQDLIQERSLKFDDSFSTNDNTRILSMTKDFCICKKSNSKVNLSFSGSKKIVEREKCPTEIAIEPKTHNLEKNSTAKKLQINSSFLSKIPSFLENHQVFS